MSVVVFSNVALVKAKSFAIGFRRKYERIKKFENVYMILYIINVWYLIKNQFWINCFLVDQAWFAFDLCCMIRLIVA